VKEVLTKVGEFIFPIDFVVLDTERVPNAESHIPVILRRHFLATSNSLISSKDGMMNLSFSNMIVDLNIFNLLRQLDGFSDVDHSTLNWVGNFSYDELEFEHVDKFTVKCESFLVDDNPKYDAFDFDMCSVDFIVDVAYACDISSVSLNLKPLPDSLKYAFLDLNEYLPVIIAFDLD